MQNPFSNFPQPPAALSEFQRRVAEMMRNSPIADLERNAKAALNQALQRLDVVTREEFETQGEMLEALRARVQTLEKRIEALENTR
jgi:ubiquinone biosynthesis accessory factor UbiK